MKRRRTNARKSVDLRKDVSEKKYWEEVLARENLRMSRGNDPRLVYVDPMVLDGRIKSDLK